MTTKASRRKPETVTAVIDGELRTYKVSRKSREIIEQAVRKYARLLQRLADK